MDDDRYPRPLTTRELQALEFLLATDFPGAEDLRVQARFAAVADRCPCGCATVEFAVDTAHASRASCAEPIPVEARTQADREGAPLVLRLFVRHGWLASLEVVYSGDDFPTEFPPPQELEAPVALQPPR